MTCLEKYLQENPNTDVDALLEDCCPNITGGIDIEDPEYCESENNECCRQCWGREVPTAELDPEVEQAMVDFLENGLGVAQILDSGERREFSTGAVRDIQEGKGRCDLMPLDVIAECYHIGFGSPGDITGDIFDRLDLFTKTGDILHLYYVLAKKEPYDSFSNMFLEVSKHFEDGAKKYGENNWQKGIPVRCYIDSAVRHYLKWLRGDKDEPHDRAFCWNVMCAIWTCKHKPELNDYKEN